MNSSILDKKTPLIVVFLITFCANITAQQHPPFIRNFSSKQFKASESNMGIGQSNNGVMYFGNFDGLLQYDGQEWRQIEIANGKTPLKIKINRQNKVYIGSLNSFGYLSIDKTGNQHYVSLSHKYEDLNFGSIKGIEELNEGIFFITNKYIFKYSNNQITYSTHPSDIAIFYTFIHNNTLYIATRNNGVFAYKNNTLTPTDLFNAYEGEIITSSIDLSDSTVLLNASGKIYTYKEAISTPHPFSADAKSILQKGAALHITKNTHADRNEYTIGSRYNGVFITSDENIIHTINNENGLRNNNIRSVLYDNTNCLWATTFKGISKVSSISKWAYWNNYHGIEGVVFDVIRHHNQLYMATTAGIYAINRNGSIEKTTAQELETYNLSKENNTLIASTFTGIYALDNNHQFTPLNSSRSSGVQQTKNGLIAHTMDGLIKIDINNKETSKLIDKNINGILQNGLIYNNRYWFSIKNDGVYTYDLSQRTTPLKFTEQQGLPSVANTFVFLHNNNLLFGTQNGIYKLNPTPKNDSSDLFIPDYGLIKERIGISHLTSDTRGNIWHVATYGKFDSRIEKLTLQKDGSYIKETRPFKRLPQQEYTTIYPDPKEEGIIWIAGTEGLFRYNDTIRVDYDLPFNTLIRKVYTGDSLLFGGTYYDPADTTTVPSMKGSQPEGFKPTLPYIHNKIRFQFTATSYEFPEKNQYSYYLEGNEDDWSHWTTENKKEYTNLSPGKYTFMVKSKNIYDTEGENITYTFIIAPPWWLTTWAYLGYFLLGIAILWGIVRINTYRLRVQRQQLKLTIADRTFEMIKQSKEIEEQNKLLKLHSEEIELQRDAISEKNQELESSQEEILTVNHQLEELNEQLEKQVAQRTLKIKSTIDELQKTNKELDTFIYRASHDLKSPISRIMGLSSLAKLELPDTVDKEYFNLIELAATDMKNLLAKLTHVHELLNKKITIKSIDVPSLLGSIRESLKHFDQYQDTKYSFNIKNGLSIHSDEDLIRIIISNLMENALIFRKETPTEAHHIDIQLYEQDGMIHIIIRDNGIGVLPEYQNDLFNMFYRASDQSKGTGLGLYVVRMAVDLFKGSIHINSKPDEFTEFTILLPV